jgi:probable rRNA maturation factor
MSSDDHAIYVNVEGAYEVDPNALVLAAWCTLDITGTQTPVAMTVQITSSEIVHQLNRTFAGDDYPTDVLSFAPEEEQYATEPGEPPYIGDVIIAYPLAVEQANVAGHPVQSELQLLAIHGTLHLMGYDHDTPEHQAEMWALQSAAMDAVRASGSG